MVGGQTYRSDVTSNHRAAFARPTWQRDAGRSSGRAFPVLMGRTAVEATHLPIYLMEVCLAVLFMIGVSVAVVITRVHRPKCIRIDIKQGKLEIEAQRPSHAHHINSSRRLE